MVKKVTKSLIIAYIVTFILLLVFAMIMFYGNIPDKVVSFLVIVTYFISSLLGGLNMGKSVENRRFIWGMFLGILYFCIIIIISLIGNNNSQEVDSSKIIGMIISCIGGMLGGMIS